MDYFGLNKPIFSDQNIQKDVGFFEKQDVCPFVNMRKYITSKVSIVYIVQHIKLYSYREFTTLKK